MYIFTIYSTAIMVFCKRKTQELSKLTFENQGASQDNELCLHQQYIYWLKILSEMTFVNQK